MLQDLKALALGALVLIALICCCFIVGYAVTLLSPAHRVDPFWMTSVGFVVIIVLLAFAAFSYGIGKSILENFR